MDEDGHTIENRGSIAIQFVDDAIRVARARGMAVDRLLEMAGIPPPRLAQSRARVSVAQYAALWRVLADEMDDEFFGLDSHPMRRGSFRLMCQAAITAATLEQGLRRAIRFLRLVLDDQRATLARDGGSALLRLEARRQDVPLFAYGTVMTMLLGLVCWLVDRRIPLERLAFAAEAPPHAAEYRVLYGERTDFGAETTLCVFDAGLLALPVQRRPADLAEFLQLAPANFLVRYRNPDSAAARLRRRLRDRSPDEWPDFETLARQLGTTASTLRRRLDDEGQPFQSIKDGLRRDLAIDLLAQPEHSVLEVAHRLGFAEPSAFHRAFRRWTGSSPGAYRGRSANP